MKMDASRCLEVLKDACDFPPKGREPVHFFLFLFLFSFSVLLLLLWGLSSSNGGGLWVL